MDKISSKESSERSLVTVCGAKFGTGGPSGAGEVLHRLALGACVKHDVVSWHVDELLGLFVMNLVQYDQHLLTLEGVFERLKLCERVVGCESTPRRQHST